MSKRITAVYMATIAAITILVLPWIPWQEPEDGPDPVYGSMADASNALATDIYRSLAEDLPGHNILFSPAGTYVSLTALYEGTAGEAAAEMGSIMSLEPDTNARRSEAMRLINAMYGDGGTTTHMASALWLRERFEPYEEYRVLLRDTYRMHIGHTGAAEAVDNEGNRDRWASDATGGLMYDISNSSGGGMLITGVAYLNGEWDPPLAGRGDAYFYRNAGGPVRADFMGTCGVFGYSEEGGMRVLRIPYSGSNLTMAVALPDSPDNMRQAESLLTAEQLRMWATDTGSAMIDVSIPEFELNTKYELRRPLWRAGIEKVFSSYNSNFSGIGDASQIGARPEQMNSLTHDAYMRAGASAASQAMPCASDHKFTANRPFIFAVYDEPSGAVVMIGRITDPTSTEVIARTHSTHREDTY